MPRRLTRLALLLAAGLAGCAGLNVTQEQGWTAFFVELTYPSAGQNELKFTTEVRVVPDVLPHKFVPKGRPQ